MTHITRLRVTGDRITAQCEKHGQIGRAHPVDGGRAAVASAARHHDDTVHGVYRTAEGYEAALSARPLAFWD